MTELLKFWNRTEEKQEDSPQPATLFSEATGKWLKRGVVVLVGLVILWLARHYLPDGLTILKDRQALIAYLEPLGFWGPLLYVLILGLQVMTAFIPGHALMIAAGYMYGFSGGFTLNLVGAVGASQLAFLLARRAGTPLVRRFVPATVFSRWQKVADRDSFFFFLICFWFPVLPSNATNYVAGVSSISFWLFFLANLLGRLPGLVVITLIGSYGLELTWQQWGLIAVAGLSVVGVGRYLTTKMAGGTT